MWPCRWAFVSWMERERGGERGGKREKVLPKHRGRGSVASELVTAWWLMGKQLDQSCTNPVPAANPASPLTHSAANPLIGQCGCRECKHTLRHEQEAQLVRNSTHSYSMSEKRDKKVIV